MDRSHAARRKRSLRHALSADVDATVHHMVGRGLPRVLTREYFNKIFNFMDRPTITRSDVEALCRSVEKSFGKRKCKLLALALEQTVLVVLLFVLALHQSS